MSVSVGMQKYNAFILFGAPGCGKGTQGRELGKLPGLVHCACGDVFRSLSPATELGRQVVEFSSRGELVPDSITIELWKTHIHGCIQMGGFDPKTDTLILDGIPRNAVQAEMLAATMNVNALFYLDCPDLSELVARLCRRRLRESRLDDTEESVVRHRLEVFERTSKPVLDFYGSDLIHTINAQQNPSGVLLDILNHIRAMACSDPEPEKDQPYQKSLA
jgi:adenylate kinase